MAKDVIVACDFSSKAELMEFLKVFGDEKLFLKIGMELFYATGSSIVSELKALGHRVFLDLKLHDIPTTVHKAMKVLSKLDVDMCNVHIAGGSNMMQKAKQAFGDNILLGVTQLTSTSQSLLNDEILIDKKMEYVVLKYAQNAKRSGLDGVVCSALETSKIHEICGKDFITVTPGIRFADEDCHDQKRAVTPAQARELGSDYIVVGRSITQSEKPKEAYKRCVREFLGK